ncbi:MAG TPA: hypothetical protein VFA09_23670 [Ktedonobacteraceae bacterium]|nr:hypothetical protein [Ktedonobacteraceae bacterium]
MRSKILNWKVQSTGKCREYHLSFIANIQFRTDSPVVLVDRGWSNVQDICNSRQIISLAE